MHARPHVLAIGFLFLAVSSTAQAAEEDTWDGLTRVASKRLERVYLLPGADFRQYGKVLIDAPRIAFRKDWQADANRGVREPSRRITKTDVDEITRRLSEGFGQILAAEFAKAGWQVVKAPGPDVLRLTPLLVNVDATAPQKTTESRADVYAVRAGSATVGLEVRDSETDQVLGRAADRRNTVEFGDQLMLTDRMTNRADFQSLLMGWSRTFVDGLAALKEASPIRAPPAKAPAPGR